jgi:quinol monooxygenase YgiN
MISRIVTCNVRPEKLTEFRNTLNQQLLPRIQKQHGFVDVVESIDTTTGTFVCNTFWNTRQDVETYENSLFQEVSKALTPFLQSEPTVQTLNVENSTVHNIAAGKKSVAA